MLKIPPQNLEAEESVLGSLMIDKDAVINITDILTPTDFYKPANGRIYETILNLFEKHQPIDILSVTNALQEKDLLKDIGGSVYLTQIIEKVPTSSHVVHYANIVKEKKILRDLISVSAEITETAFKPNDEIDSILDVIEQKIFSISQRSIRQKFFQLKEELDAAYERIENLHRGEGRLRGVSTGFTDLDSCLSGLQKSDLIILGARPSLGKTALALDIARYVTTKEKKSVGIFSLEMSKEQLVDRFIASEAQVPLWKLRTGRLTDDTDFALIQSALDSLHHAPLFIDDTPGITVLQMKSMARRLQIEHGLDLLIVDYLQLIHPRTSSDNVVQQITEISRSLKGLARELCVPVLALSQLSRSVDQREVKIPRLSDLRESGSIEQDADVVLFIYRKDRDKLNTDTEEQNSAEIIISKHRNGPLGTVRLKFDQEKVSFRNIDKLH